jgi:4-hydroxy-tetrahydrodipicolinate synthase
MTGLTIPISVITRLHNWRPGRFKGIKDSSGKLEYCRELAASLPEFTVFPSSEVSLGEAHQSRFAGCISATTNQTATLSAKIWANRKNPDADAVREINQLRDNIAGTALIPSIKYLVARRTNQDLWENLLPPFCTLSSEQKSNLATVVDQLSYA